MPRRRPRIGASRQRSSRRMTSSARSRPPTRSHRDAAAAIVALLVALLVVVAAGGGLLVPRAARVESPARAGRGGASPLALVTTHMDRQRLESGNELLTVTGRVINPTGKEQDVPPLQAQLKDRARARSSIAGPSRRRRGRLSPGASASFNSAEVNVPPGGEELTISLGAPGPKRLNCLLKFDQPGGLGSCLRCERRRRSAAARRCSAGRRGGCGRRT